MDLNPANKTVSKTIMGLFPLWEEWKDKLLRVHSELRWVITGQLLAALGGFAAIKVLTNLLDPAAYGELALGITIAGLVQIFVYGPVDQTVLRFVSVHRERGSLGVFIAALKRIHRLAAFVVLPAALLGSVVVYYLANGEWGWLTLSSGLFGAASGFYGTFVSLHNGFRQRKVVALHQSLDVWIRLCLAVFTVTVFGPMGAVVLVGYLLGAIVMAVSILKRSIALPLLGGHWTSGDRREEDVKSAIREFLGFGKPFLYFALFGLVSTYADRWIIFGSLGEEAVGRYAVIYQLANAPIALAVGVINQFVVPVIFDRAGAVSTDTQSISSTRLLNQFVVLFGAIILLLVSATYLFSESVVRVIASAEFVPYHHLLWIMVLGLGVFQLAQFLVVKGLSHNVTEGYVVPKLLQAVGLLVLLWSLLNGMGIVGVPWAIVFSSMLYLCAVLWVNRGIGKIAAPIR